MPKLFGLLGDLSGEDRPDFLGLLICIDSRASEVLRVMSILMSISCATP
jgi:hypothetical protein